MSGARRAAVLFDWGETLVSIPGMLFQPEAHLACARAAFLAVVAPRLRTVDEGRFMDCYERAARAQIRSSAETLREHRFDDRVQFALQLAEVTEAVDPALPGDFARRLGDEVLKGLALVHPDVPEVVRTLQRRYRLGIVSNYPFGQVVVDSLALLGLADAFDAVVVSSEVGWMKPHPAIFAAAVQALGATGARTAFVGDSVRADMEGAKAAGMLTAWYAPGQARERPAAADVHLERLADLVPWCEERLQ